MKDYSFGKNKEFILGYEVKDKQIIVKYAKNKTISFPYSKEKEIKILNKMKEQVSENIYTTFDKKIKDESWAALCIGGVSGCFSVAAIFSMVFFGFDIVLGVLATATAGCSLLTIIDATMCKVYLDDFKKNKLFLANKNKIEYMMEENVKMFDKALAETEEAKIYNELQQPQFTLNTVNQLSLKELKGIVESIDHSRELEVETVDAFKETLEVLQKSKKKEKVKRK